MNVSADTYTRLLALTTLLGLASCVTPGEAREATGSVDQATGDDPLVEVLLESLSTVETKLLALADAFAQEEYDWRPADGVRSGAEVFMHVAESISVLLFTQDMTCLPRQA